MTQTQLAVAEEVRGLREMRCALHRSFWALIDAQITALEWVLRSAPAPSVEWHQHLPRADASDVALAQKDLRHFFNDIDSQPSTTT
jgi:hypothetical protein